MSRPRTLTDDAMRRLLTAAQQLHRPRRRSAVDLVRHLTGVQAQVLSAAGPALRARTEGLTAERVDGSRLRDRSIVLTWAMRGTLHLIAAEDYGWLVPLVTEPRVANSHRRLKQEGVPAEPGSPAVHLIERMLDRHGPLTRPEIADRLRRHLLGWKERDLTVPPQHWKKINRGGGWLGAVALADGRAVGTWTTERAADAVRMTIHPISRLAQAIHRGIRAEAVDLAEFLGRAVELKARRPH